MKNTKGRVPQMTLIARLLACFESFGSRVGMSRQRLRRQIMDRLRFSRRRRLSIEFLETRRVFAVGNLSGGILTIDLNQSNESAYLYNDGTSMRLGSTHLASELTFAASSVTSITVTDASGRAGQTFSLSPGSPISLSGSFSVLNVETVVLGGELTVAGSAGVSISSAGSIQITAPLTTTGDPLTLSASDGITITQSVITAGGNQTINADSDSNGTGALTLDFPFGEFVDPNPNAGNRFGANRLVLTSGNVVITSPMDDLGGTDAGAVYLFNAMTGALVSTLRGSSPGDQIGSNGATFLNNGNFLISSPFWDTGSVTDVGAVTWGNGFTGFPSGVISSSNSLVGSSANDSIGSSGISTLSNGNYVVSSTSWDSGTVGDVGAVTWGSGSTGISGIVRSNNSLVGSSPGDMIGNSGISVLTTGNYIVRSNNWDSGTASDAGAVTWGNGQIGITGIISSNNSLVGSTANDYVGVGGIAELSNGNYVVMSYLWNSIGTRTGVGAITWGNGSTGITGVVSSTNSLVGSSLNDNIGDSGFYYLSNGNYVVRSQSWDSGTASNVGAVTWGNASTAITGVVSSNNSLVGSITNDSVGSGGITALSNGNYIVSSFNWDSGTLTDVGAVTWGNGTIGVKGLVSSVNSLVGSRASDNVGSSGITSLSNGNYVVRSAAWDSGTITNVGAVTWGNGTSGITGVVSSNNSLVGSTASDNVGSVLITTLANGNYIVNTPVWDSGTMSNVGAVTWGNGAAGITGVVSSLNSLVGSRPNDAVGSGGITTLSSGHYVVVSTAWDSGTVLDVGAVTWGNGSTGRSGVVSSTNSLVGSQAFDGVGGRAVFTLSNGNYLVSTTNWDFGTVLNVGALTWGNGTTGISGVVSSNNSLVGSSGNDSIGSSVVFLNNGNYVVSSQNWDSGTVANVGAVTWGNGATGISGVVSSNNSLVGSTAGDTIGSSIDKLSNGNYVLRSPVWDSGTVPNVGAVTWGNGTTGITGVVSSSNSLVGSMPNDLVGNIGNTILSNSNYVVVSTSWDSGTAINAGAVTWGNGRTGIAGVVSSSNSLVGSIADDRVGNGGITPLNNGGYVVNSPYWDFGILFDAGALTWGSDISGVSGLVSSSNSIVSKTSNSGWGWRLPNSTLDGILIANNMQDGTGRVVVGSVARGFRLPATPAGSLQASSGLIDLSAGDANLSGVITSNNSVRISPSREIDLGTNNPGKLGLTDAELDLVSTPSLSLGTITNGITKITSSISRPTATDVSLLGSVEFAAGLQSATGVLDTAGGSLLMDVGVGGLRPNSSGHDVKASVTTLTSGDTLRIAINGSAVDTQYSRLSVDGSIALQTAGIGVALNLTVDSQSITGTESFTIVNATGGVSGTFAGLSQGAPVSIGIYPYKINYGTNTVQLTPAPTEPAVITHPANQTVTAGSTATFSAAASGSPTPTVQWQINTGSGWSNISGATSTSYTTPATTFANSGNQYRAVFTNAAGTATTNAATLTVQTVPSITTQPSNQTVTAGNTATFSAAASGSPTPTVQWQINTGSGWSNISSATSSSYTTPATTLANSGTQYRAVFTNAAGTATTNAATLTVQTVPSITTQPSNQTVTAGNTATFSAAASGSPTPTLQWQINTGSGWSNISGATSTSYATPATTLANSGTQYRAVFTNAAGSATTNAATLTVQTVPSITTQPSNQSVTEGSTATFSAAASGSPTPTVQWQINTGSGWANISGATSTSYTTPATTFANSGNQYRAVFTNAAGSATTNAAILTVQTVPSITTQPSNQSVTEGNTATFNAAASGSPTPTLQWQINTGSGWSNISGATSTSYATPATTLANSGTQYRAVFTNAAGSATTNAATLTVQSPLVFTSSNNTSFIAGRNSTFSVNASGSPTPSFELVSGSLPEGVSLSSSGELSGTPSLASVGSYLVVIRATNGVGTAPTQAFTLRVLAPLTDSPLDVNRGQIQRSYIRYADISTSDNALAADIVTKGRIKLIRADLNGNGLDEISLNGLLSIDGTKVSIDFGTAGIGGSRNTSAADGYYTLQLDLDGDNVFETNLKFYRLLGDVNGDREVSSADITTVQAAIGSPNAQFDLNGDGVVNTTDLILVRRALGRRLANGLLVDD
jgi:hypothetical protein